MNRGDQDGVDQSRRSFITRAVYVAPVVLSLKADLAFASYGSGKPVRGNNGEDASASYGSGKPVRGNNGVGNGEDAQPPGNPPVNDGPGTGPGHPGQRRR